MQPRRLAWYATVCCNRLVNWKRKEIFTLNWCVGQTDRPVLNAAICWLHQIARLYCLLHGLMFCPLNVCDDFVRSAEYRWCYFSHFSRTRQIIIIIIPGQCLWCCHHAVAALREFTLFTRRVQHGARWPPTFGPSRSAWTISPPVGCQLTTLTIAIAQ